MRKIHIALIAACVVMTTSLSLAAEPVRYVKIGHYQCECRQGNFDANLATVRKGLAQAVDVKLDIVSFPECFLTGYFAKEQDARKHMFAVDSPEMKRVLELTDGCDTTLVVGFNESRGDKLFNTSKRCQSRLLVNIGLRIPP